MAVEVAAARRRFTRAEYQRMGEVGIFRIRLTGRAVVHVQSGIVLADDSEPEPDISVLRHRPVPYKEREAHADDVLLVVEVVRDVARVAGAATVIPQAFGDVAVPTAEIFA